MIRFRMVLASAAVLARRDVYEDILKDAYEDTDELADCFRNCQPLVFSWPIGGGSEGDDGLCSQVGLVPQLELQLLPAAAADALALSSP